MPAGDGTASATEPPGFQVLRRRLGYLPSFLEALGGGSRARLVLSPDYLAAL